MSERAPIQEVNIELGDDVSKMLYEASKLTHQNRPGFLVEYHESFSGFRAIPGSVLKDADNLLLNLGFDGVGTKVEVAERLEDHSVVAHDLFAMVCDDAVVRGAEPVAIGSILDVRQLSDNEYTRRAVQELATGYIEAAKKANVVIVNGEVAELGDRVGGYFTPSSRLEKFKAFWSGKEAQNDRFNYNWGAAVLWIAHKDRILTGHNIKPGDALIGLAEEGFRSNGLTDVRKAMLDTYGKKWQNVVVDDLGESSLGRLVQQPSTIYSRFVTELNGGYDLETEPKARITGVAHITGGGIPGKLGRMLEPSGFAARIDTPLPTPQIIKHVQRLCDFANTTAYRKWNMGTGMIIATPEPDRVLELAQKREITAQLIGSVVAGKRITINMPSEELKSDEFEHFYL